MNSVIRCALRDAMQVFAALWIATAIAQDAPLPLPANTADAAATPASTAIREVLAHPDFKHEETRRMPRWKYKPEERKSDWMKGVEAFFRALAKVLRVGVWVIAAIGVLLLIFTLHYWWRVRARVPKSTAIAVPTHVGGLDIRLQSLPDNIAAAARVRWQAGDREGALSLLYRGALSRLVHQYACTIGSSFTEDECVAAAKLVLTSSAHAYFSEQTHVWVLAIYGRRWPEEVSAMRLIDAFDIHFPVDAAAAESGALPTRGAPA